MICRTSAISLHRSDSRTTSASGDGAKFGGKLARSSRSMRIACAIRSIMLRLPVGRINPGIPTRSPPSTRTSESANAITSVRYNLVSRASGEAKYIDRDRSGQIHTVCAASHSCSRTYKWSSRAERRQSTLEAGSPETKRRYCQKFSPGPARRRPWRPWITVAATRRASRISRGMLAASVRPSPDARPTAAASWYVRCGERESGDAVSVTIDLSDPSLKSCDHGFNRFALRARSEGKRHPVLENGLSELDDVIDGRRQSGIKQCAGAHREHQRLTRPRTWTPGNQFGASAAIGARTRGSHQRQNRLDDGIADRKPAHQSLRRHQVVGCHRRFWSCLFGACGFENYSALGFAAGIADINFHEETIELRFRKRVCAFLLERVLRRKDMEWLRQIVSSAGDGDMLFLHRLQQRRLGARAGAIDFVGHQQLRKYWSGDEAKAALAGLAFFQDFGAENVRGHEIGRKLNAPRVKAEHGAQCVDKLCLGQTGQAKKEGMAAGQYGYERLLDHLFLTEYDRADCCFGGAHMCRGGFRRTHDHVFDLFEPFSAGSGHSQLLAFKRCIGSDSRHMNERQRICTPFGVMRCNHTRIRAIRPVQILR